MTQRRRSIARAELGMAHGTLLSCMAGGSDIDDALVGAQEQPEGVSRDDGDRRKDLIR